VHLRGWAPRKGALRLVDDADWTKMTSSNPAIPAHFQRLKAVELK
jgi:hypothetical protein